MIEPKTPLHVRCGNCGHVWVACWLPMEISKAATLMQRGCPMCRADAHRIFIHQPEESQ
jgi:hypothetical protein